MNHYGSFFHHIEHVLGVNIRGRVGHYALSGGDGTSAVAGLACDRCGHVAVNVEGTSDPLFKKHTALVDGRATFARSIDGHRVWSDAATLALLA